jgi:hypothetical protein
MWIHYKQNISSNTFSLTRKLLLYNYLSSPW